VLNIRLYFLLLTIAGLFAACSSDQTETDDLQDHKSADLVLIGGEIATVDPALGNVEALAVDGYRIAAVGSNEEISAYIGPQTEVIELDGRFVMPGFIE
jgi:imidazolonepropionase-like amidohydrolase